MTKKPYSGLNTLTAFIKKAFANFAPKAQVEDLEEKTNTYLLDVDYLISSIISILTQFQ